MQALESAPQLPPLRFLPLRRFPSSGQLLFTQGYQPRATVPSQRFSRSQGLLPPATCRPYFVPVPPLGFSPSGPIPPVKHSALSSFSALLRLAHLAVAASTVSHRRVPRTLLVFFDSIFAKQHFARFAPLQGFAPHERSHLLSTDITVRRPRPSWAFSSLGISPFPSLGLPRSPILS